MTRNVPCGSSLQICTEELITMHIIRRFRSRRGAFPVKARESSSTLLPRPLESLLPRKREASPWNFPRAIPYAERSDQEYHQSDPEHRNRQLPQHPHRARLRFGIPVNSTTTVSMFDKLQPAYMTKMAAHCKTVKWREGEIPAAK